MDILRNMQIFVEVAREKSFRGAADNLGIPNSTVSRRIAELERDVGLRLFDRSTRRVTLTDAGKLHFANCERILDDANLAHEQLTDLRASPSGKLRIVSNVVPANEWIVPLLPAFSLRYPDIEVELDIISEEPSPMGKGVDVAFVMGPITQEDLVGRKIIRLTALGLYASPSYIQEHGNPTNPAELRDHEGLRHLRLPEWKLINNSSGKVETVSPRGRISVANFDAIHKLCLADMGICIWHEWRARKLVEDGRLQHVLPQWSLEPWEFFAVTTSRHVPAKARALIDFLIEEMPG
jgi:DNA-binding transcriptional LysR family regulator